MTRPSLADIALRDALRVHLKGAGAPALMAEKNAAAAADVPALLAVVQSVLAVADQLDRLAARHPDSETGQVETAAAHEIRRAVTAHIDTTPKEKP